MQQEYLLKQPQCFSVSARPLEIYYEVTFPLLSIQTLELGCFPPGLL